MLYNRYSHNHFLRIINPPFPVNSKPIYFPWEEGKIFSAYSCPECMFFFTICLLRIFFRNLLNRIHFTICFIIHSATIYFVVILEKKKLFSIFAKANNLLLISSGNKFDSCFSILLIKPCIINKMYVSATPKYCASGLSTHPYK